MDIPFKSIKYIFLLLIFLFIFGGLSLKKIKLFCFGCSKGSWWYECLEGTGYGSVQCDVYKETYNTIAEVINSITIVTEQIQQIIDNFISVFNNIKNTIKNVGKNIIEQLILPDISLPQIPIPNISCNVRIIGDMCSPINSIVREIINQLNNTSSFISILFNQIKDIFSLVLNFLKLIVEKFIELFTTIFDDITLPIANIYKIIMELKVEINDIYKSFSNLGLSNIVIYHILSGLNNILPINALASYSLALLFIIIIIGLIALGIIFSIGEASVGIFDSIINIIEDIKNSIYNVDKDISDTSNLSKQNENINNPDNNENLNNKQNNVNVNNKN